MKYFLIAVVVFYRFLISPLIGPTCRFQPTCSQYAIEALRKRGTLEASRLIVRRLFRCHPWGGSGSDPVP